MGDRKSKRSPANDTALHVIKGALVKTLGPEANITTAVAFSTPTKASIVIQYDQEVSEEQRAQIQSAANEIIKQNVEVKEFTMERKAAEAEITQLAIVEISDWNVNCCQGPHTKTTGELEALCVLKIKKKGKKGETEVLFDIGKPAIEGLKAQGQVPSSGRIKVDKRAKPQHANSTTTSVPTQTSSVKKENKPEKPEIKQSSSSFLPASSSLPSSSSSDVSVPVLSKTEVKQESQGATRGLVMETTNLLIDDFLSTLRTNPSLLNDEASLQNILFPKIQFTLNSFQNLAYAEGYSSRLRSVAYNI